ncbi:MAG: efflux RND transporter periplasmic adaptor subunit [Cyclobacteriaceae bacterium]
MKTIQSYTSVLGSVLVALASLWSCTSSEPVDSTARVTSETTTDIFVSHQQFASAGMKLGRISTQQLFSTIETRGYIDVPPGSRAAVSPFYSGYVKAVDILPGQQVERGQLLLVLENPLYIQMQQEYLEVKEQIDYLRSDFERQQALAEEKIASGKTAKKAATDYKMMLARYNGIREQLKLMNVSISRLDAGKITSSVNLYAPISGSITKVNASRGSFIDATEVAVEIVDAEHMHLELDVFEQDIRSVTEGQSIQFSVPESGDNRFAGTVYLVSKSVDPEHRTVAVHGHITDGDEVRFIPGMFVNAEIVVSSAPALCLPENAVVDIEGQMMVAIKRSEDADGISFELTTVEIGRHANGWIEILNPRIEGDEILVKGAFDVIQ